MTQKNIQLNTVAKGIKQLNPGGPEADTVSGPNPLIYR